MATAQENRPDGGTGSIRILGILGGILEEVKMLEIRTGDLIDAYEEHYGTDLDSAIKYMLEDLEDEYNLARQELGKSPTAKFKIEGLEE